MKLILTFSLALGSLAYGDDRSWAIGAESEPVCADFISLPPNHLKLKKLAIRAARRLPAIKRAVAAQGKDTHGYFDKIARAAEAAVTKHQREYMEENDLRKMDFQRHLAILEEIERFDEARPQYALFKIKRVIETRHSIAKYADCIEDDDDADHPAH